jgi:transketolase
MVQGIKIKKNEIIVFTVYAVMLRNGFFKHRVFTNFEAIFTLNSDYFRTSHKLVCLMEGNCAFCRAQNKYLFLI